MSYYTTIRCKCIVKQRFREFIGQVINEISNEKEIQLEDKYLNDVLNDGSRFRLFFYDKNKWYESIEEEEIVYSYDVSSGAWHFHVAINREEDEIEEFLVRFRPKYLEKIETLEIYDENSVEQYLQGRRDTYLITDFILDWIEGRN